MSDQTPGFYRRYDQFFHNNRFTPTGILEIGVHQGESTKVFAAVYPNTKIVALDLKRYDHLDFSGFPNITYLGVDQTDRERLENVIKDEFPAGFDLVIEDASHIGAYSHITFHTVFPCMKPGGIYIVEDWVLATLTTSSTVAGSRNTRSTSTMGISPGDCRVTILAWSALLNRWLI